MKEMIIVSFIFLLLIMVVSCAATPHALPERYNLDNDLEAVDQISIYKITDCENIDNQSIILRADRNDYFLLVLRQPIDINCSYLSIDTESFENTASKDEAYSTQLIIGYKNTSREGWPNTEFVQAPSNMATIVSGYDRVVVKEGAYKSYYIIDKIYKLKGKEQAREIKERLSKI